MQAMLYEYIDQKYKNLSQLGRTDKDTVWLAQDAETGHIVVKKYISSAYAGIYECLKSVCHPNLVPILYTAQRAQEAVVVMEYVSGLTIEEYLERNGVFSERDAVIYMIQLLQGLRTVHERGIIHRDINPHNLLISTDGVLKILDFDIGRIYRETKERDTQILGTAGYAAPEQFGFRQSDARTDIYAAGILLNYILTGKEPCEQLYADETISKIIQTCIRIDPDRRYRNADEMLGELEKIQTYRMRRSGKEVPQDAAEPQNRCPQTSEPIPAFSAKTSIWPGFRTGVLWKKMTASLYYVIMGIYSAGCVFLCRADPAAFLLETAAVFIYIWLAAFLPLNFLGWMEKVPFIRQMGRIQRMILGIVLWLLLFVGGYELDEYVSVSILHILP